jgi:hypothetical protein
MHPHLMIVGLEVAGALGGRHNNNLLHPHRHLHCHLDMNASNECGGSPRTRPQLHHPTDALHHRVGYGIGGICGGVQAKSPPFALIHLDDDRLTIAMEVPPQRWDGR